MLNRILVALSLVLVTQLAVPMARAQDKPAVALAGEVMVERSVEENGATRTVLEAPTNVIPGDRLVFTTRYTNTIAEPVDDFVITNPLPAAVILLQDGDFDVSVDGGKTFGRFSTLSVKLEDGADRPAELGDVTHIRWTLARLAPGEQGQVRYFAAIR